MILKTKDIEILKALQKNADISNSALSKIVKLSPPACLARVRNLKERGLIRSIIALLNADQLGFSLTVLVYIKLDNQTRDTLSYLEGAVKINPKVQECFRMTGEHDYILRLLLKNTQELEFFLTNELSRIPNVASIRTEVAMQCVKQSNSIPF
ncbi:Lrp/AsnC family transcriptional regulator [Litorivicinus sp.]|nr:Lrp/AsnC family transcriptional regulator [Litorivicinus sp.]MDB9862415.1 Lrp/AsnC family transcriptional regulator [Litorivicinus sp.]MDC1208621.1 Lrp/AsnC family transcriptional regulator [Litorivicinus sp.]